MASSWRGRCCEAFAETGELEWRAGGAAFLEVVQQQVWVLALRAHIPHRPYSLIL